METAAPLRKKFVIPTRDDDLLEKTDDFYTVELSPTLEELEESIGGWFFPLVSVKCLVFKVFATLIIEGVDYGIVTSTYYFRFAI